MDEKDRVVRWADRLGPRGQSLRQAVALAVALTVVVVLAAGDRADRTQLKPGWNMFSPQQDVEVGQQVSKDAEQQLPMLNNSRVDNYVNNLGRRLAAKAPGEKYSVSIQGRERPGDQCVCAARRICLHQPRCD